MRDRQCSINKEGSLGKGRIPGRHLDRLSTPGQGRAPRPRARHERIVRTLGSGPPVFGKGLKKPPMIHGAFSVRRDKKTAHSKRSAKRFMFGAGLAAHLISMGVLAAQWPKRILPTPVPLPRLQVSIVCLDPSSGGTFDSDGHPLSVPRSRPLKVVRHVAL